MASQACFSYCLISLKLKKFAITIGCFMQMILMMLSALESKKSHSLSSIIVLMLRNLEYTKIRFYQMKCTRRIGANI